MAYKINITNAIYLRRKHSKYFSEFKIKKNIRPNYFRLEIIYLYFYDI
jgi:hypothetical protein